MLQKVRDTIKAHRMLVKGDRVIVGFSGGIDSLCLLHILHQLVEYELDLWAVYINHSLRPAENLREVELLRQIGRDWGIKVREIKLDIPKRLQEKPQSLQLLAREERYNLLIGLKEEINASKIALGHHRDDQVETVLYRIIRGTGIDGLAGIPIMRDNLFIRPLLEVSRAEIREYVLNHQLLWLEDSSNLKPVYMRNKLRLQLIPELKKTFNPNLNSALIRLARLAHEQQELMEALLKENWEKLTVIREERIGVVVEKFVELPAYLQYYLLKRILGKIRSNRQFESNVLLRLRDGIVNQRLDFKPMQLSKTILAHNLEGVIFFENVKRDFTVNPDIFRLNTPGVTVIPELDLEVTIEKVYLAPKWNEIGPYEVFIDGDRPNLPFYIRFWRYGDQFHPLGAPGSQKLHDFFINRKISREERTKTPLLVTADDRIVWIAGYRLSELYKITGNTTEVWHVSFNRINQT